MVVFMVYKKHLILIENVAEFLTVQPTPVFFYWKQKRICELFFVPVTLDYSTGCSFFISQ